MSIKQFYYFYYKLNRIHWSATLTLTRVETWQCMKNITRSKIFAMKHVISGEHVGQNKAQELSKEVVHCSRTNVKRVKNTRMHLHR